MKRNTELINQLADRIEKCKEVELNAHKSDMGPSFTMFAGNYPCGAAACIVGHNQDMHGRAVIRFNAATLSTLAADLGIGVSEAHELCAPISHFASYISSKGDPWHITKHHAVAVLRNLAATGEVDWKIGSST